MTQFEFLMMIASVVVAVGMTEIVSGLVLCALAYSQRVWLHGAVLVFLIGSVIAYFFSHVAVQDQRWLG